MTRTWTDWHGVSCLEVPDRGGLGRNQPGDPFEGAGIITCHLIDPGFGDPCSESGRCRVSD